MYADRDTYIRHQFLTLFRSSQRIRSKVQMSNIAKDKTHNEICLSLFLLRTISYILDNWYIRDFKGRWQWR